MRLLAWIPALVVAVVIWWLSDTPNLALAHGWLDTVSRKSAHVGAFGLLAALSILAWRAQGVRPARCLVLGAALALAYAGVDEWHQSHVPTRNGTPVDVAIDAIGVGIASIVLAMAFRRREIP